MAFAEGEAAGLLEAELVGIDVVIAAVIDDDFEVDDGIAGEETARGFRLDDAFFHGGDEVAGDGSAENIILKHEAAAARASAPCGFLQSPNWPWPPDCFWRP